MDLPPEIVAILAAFAPLFSDRAWIKAQILAVGAILATGDRTVCAALRSHGPRARSGTSPTTTASSTAMPGPAWPPGRSYSA